MVYVPRYCYLSCIVLLSRAIPNDLSRSAFLVASRRYATVAAIRFNEERNVAVSGIQLALRSIEHEQSVVGSDAVFKRDFYTNMQIIICSRTRMFHYKDKKLRLHNVFILIDI